jgi:hypothetical protein
MERYIKGIKCEVVNYTVVYKVIKFRFPQRRTVSWLAEQTLASQEWFCPMEWNGVTGLAEH